MRTVAYLAAACAGWFFVGSAGAEEIAIGMVSGITGPIASTTADLLKVSSGYVSMVNSQGRVNGNTLHFVTRDDGYDSKRTPAMVEDAINKDHVVALVNGAGTSNTLALIKSGILDKYKVPLVGVYSGSDAIRGANAGQVFHTRASYADEVFKISRLMTTIGLTKVAVMYQDDGFGTAINDSLAKAMQKYHFEVIAKVPYKAGNTDFAEQVKKITASQPQAILLMGVPDAVYGFMKQYKAPVGAAQIYALSFVTTKGLAEYAGAERIRGMGLTQVVPNPASTVLPLSADFNQFLGTPFGKGVTASPLTFEAYLNIRLVVEAIRQAGAHPTAESVTRSLASMDKIKLGGFPIDFGHGNRRGSSYLDIAVIGRQARLSY